MAGFIRGFSSFWNTVKEGAVGIITQPGDRKRKREDSDDAPDGPGGATSPAKRRAAAPAEQSSQPSPAQNGATHGLRQPQESGAPPAAGRPLPKPVFSPGFHTEQRRSSSRFAPRQPPAARQKPAAQAAPYANGEVHGHRRQLNGYTLQQPSLGLAATPYTTPAARTCGRANTAAAEAGPWASPQGNGALPPATAAAYRNSTRRRGQTPSRVHGPGGASRGFGAQRRLLPGFGGSTSGMGGVGSQPQQQHQTPSSSQVDIASPLSKPLLE